MLTSHPTGFSPFGTVVSRRHRLTTDRSTDIAVTIAPASTVQRNVTTESAGHEDSWTTRTGQPPVITATRRSSTPAQHHRRRRQRRRWSTRSLPRRCSMAPSGVLDVSTVCDDNFWYRRQSSFQQLDVTADDVTDIEIIAWTNRLQQQHRR